MRVCVRACVLCVRVRARLCACACWREGGMLASHPNGKRARDILFSGRVGKCVCRWSCRGGVPEKAVPSPSRSERVEKPCSNAPSTPSASNVCEAKMLKVTFHLAGLFSFQIKKIKALFHFS